MVWCSILAAALATTCTWASTAGKVVDDGIGRSVEGMCRGLFFIYIFTTLSWKYSV